MTLNKYNEYMSHIEVTDEMKARVLANVSKAIAEQKTDGAAKADVTPMPVARKKKPLPIAVIISIAASVLIVGGIAVMFLSGYMNSGSTYSSSKAKNTDTAEATVAAAGEYYVKDSLDGAAVDCEETEGGNDDADEDSVEWDTEETTQVTTAETSSVTRPVKGPDAGIPDDNIQTLLPDSSLETSTSVENGTSIITFNAATNSGTLYIADEGVDLASTYLAGVTWNTSNSTTGVTEGGIPYALVNTNTPDVTTFNAATFEHDGKTYLIVFDTPVPEESLRTVIEDY